MNKKKKAEKSLKQSKFKEISMGSDSIDQLFDSSHKIGFETEDEREYREKKEDYNEELIEKIKKYIFEKKFNFSNFTERQQEIFKLMFQDGLSQLEIARKLNIKRRSVGNVKEVLIKKIKSKISYNFSSGVDTDQR